MGSCWYTGLAFALLLRFEFLNSGIRKIVAFCTAGSMGLIIYILVVEAFGDGAPALLNSPSRDGQER